VSRINPCYGEYPWKSGGFEHVDQGKKEKSVKKKGKKKKKVRDSQILLEPKKGERKKPLVRQKREGKK